MELVHQSLKMLKIIRTAANNYRKKYPKNRGMVPGKDHEDLENDRRWTIEAIKGGVALASISFLLARQYLLILPTWFAGLVAFFAVNRPVRWRAEGYFGFLSAFSTSSLEHLTRASVWATVPLLLPGSAATGAPAGFIFKTLGSVKFLFIGSENKVFAAVTAVQGFILVHAKTSFSKDS